jgi:hypothetical protein
VRRHFRSDENAGERLGSAVGVHCCEAHHRKTAKFRYPRTARVQWTLVIYLNPAWRYAKTQQDATGVVTKKFRERATTVSDGRVPEVAW